MVKHIPPGCGSKGCSSFYRKQPETKKNWPDATPSRRHQPPLIKPSRTDWSLARQKERAERAKPRVSPACSGDDDTTNSHFDYRSGMVLYARRHLFPVSGSPRVAPRSIPSEPDSPMCHPQQISLTVTWTHVLLIQPWCHRTLLRRGVNSPASWPHPCRACAGTLEVGHDLLERGERAGGGAR
jgi:hypothetical protein